MLKKVIARLLERYAEERGIALHGYGSTTFRQEAKARGLEPDECYCVGVLKDLPDIAIEINLTSGGLNKLAVYQGLGVPEVMAWQANRLTLYALQGNLQDGQGQIVTQSQFFPDLNLALLQQYIWPQNQP